MNAQSVFAFLIAAVVLAGAVVSAGDLGRFLDGHAALVVIGGTIAAGAISFQIDRIVMMFRIFLRSVLQGNGALDDTAALLSEMMELADAYRLGTPGLKARVEACREPFLKEAMTMLLEEVLDPPRLLKALRERVETIYQAQTEEVVQFRTVGKYPPAFGLIGTTLSMITLLQKLGSPEGQKLIGPSMALGLVATFYGLILANLVFNPISENLAARTRRVRTRNTIIVEGIGLILQKTNPIILAEELNSFLIPSRRIDLTARRGSGAGAGHASGGGGGERVA